MSKKTHQKELARARAKREAERAVKQRQSRMGWVIGIVVVAVIAIVVGFSLGGDDDPAVAVDDTTGGLATDTDQFGTEAATEPGGTTTEPPATTETEPVAATCPSPEGVPEVADLQYDAAPEMVIDPAKTYTATITTTCGVIELELFAADAPLAVNNLVFLAREGYYDGVIFHRVIPGFMIQGGDPTGTGSGGPGYSFEDELDTVAKYGFGRGMLAMANAGAATNGSQFFIVQGDASHLTTHTVFGQVTSGIEVVDNIANTPSAGDRPIEDVAILSIEITES